MRWTVTNDGVSEDWYVLDADGTVESRHDDHGAAVARMAALYAEAADERQIVRAAVGMESRLRRHVTAREVRIVGDGSARQFDARVLSYGVPDDYGTVWAPGVFNKSLEARLPKCAWSHDWQEPIGRVVAWAEADGGLNVTVQLSDFEAVPRARQAWAQIADGTISEFSVGFVRRKWTTFDGEAAEEFGGDELMIEADLDEISPVLWGAVPGTKKLAVRSALRSVEGFITIDDANNIFAKLGAGQIDLADALAEVKQRATTMVDPGRKPGDETEAPAVPPEGEETPEGEVEEQEPPEDELALLAEADAALAETGRSR